METLKSPVVFGGKSFEGLPVDSKILAGISKKSYGGAEIEEFKM